MLFVNWVSCGTSALSLRIASLDRLSYFMLSYRHRCSKFADLVRLCEYLSTFFKCKNTSKEIDYDNAGKFTYKDQTCGLAWPLPTNTKHW